MAFHLYPQVIPQFCNTGGFGPRRGLTPASPCPWVAHLVSGRILATLPLIAPASDSLSLRLHGFYNIPLNHLPPRRPNTGGRCQHTLAGSFYKRHAVRQLANARGADQRIPPTACQCRGSEALSSPSRGAFHLSLTVLVHYRWPGVFAPWRVVPPASHRISRVPWYSGIPSSNPAPGVRYGTLTRSGGPSQTLRVPRAPLLCAGPKTAADAILQPQRPLPFQTASLVWAPTRFARHYYGPLHHSTSRRCGGIAGCPTILLILLPRGTEMFQFPRFPPAVLPRWSRPITDGGLPHSDSVGSSLACSSPTTFRRAPRPSSAPGP